MRESREKRCEAQIGAIFIFTRTTAGSLADNTCVLGVTSSIAKKRDGGKVSAPTFLARVGALCRSLSPIPSDSCEHSFKFFAHASRMRYEKLRAK